MSDPVAIIAALEKAVAAATPALPAVYRNDTFDPPDGAAGEDFPAYQRITVSFAEPNDYGLDSEFQEVGFAQVLFVYPKGRGWGEAVAQAKALRVAFKKNTRIPTAGGGYVKVMRTPALAEPLDEPDGFMVPVRIRFSNL